MKDYSTITKLFYLLIHADGNVNEKEVALGKKMVAIEGLSNVTFENELKKLEGLDKEQIFNECLNGLLKLPKAEQINYIAWMSLIANSDGFMDKREWDLIYKIYKKGLNLSLDDIMNRQRDLNHMVNSRLHAA